jgi:hypothetical protein
MVQMSLARRLQRVGWILVGVGALCAFSIVFLPAGVIAGGAGILCLLAALVARRVERVAGGAIPAVPGQPVGAATAGGAGLTRD